VFSGVSLFRSAVSLPAQAGDRQHVPYEGKQQEQDENQLSGHFIFPPRIAECVWPSTVRGSAPLSLPPFPPALSRQNVWHPPASSQPLRIHPVTIQGGCPSRWSIFDHWTPGFWCGRVVAW